MLACESLGVPLDELEDIWVLQLGLLPLWKNDGINDGWNKNYTICYHHFCSEIFHNDRTYLFEIHQILDMYS